jgi:cobalt-zinc-cadmium efflux system outer membrane protein
MPSWHFRSRGKRRSRFTSSSLATISKTISFDAFTRTSGLRGSPLFSISAFPAVSLLLPLVFAVQTQSPAPAASTPDPFVERSIAETLWRRSPELTQARLGLIEGEATRDRSHLLPNPTLGATWSTIPLGERNPPGQPFWSVPNYGVQLGSTFEIGKRGPRQRAAEAGLSAARLDLEDSYHQAFFAVMEALAGQAEAVARVAVLQRLVADGQESLRLQRARAERGDVAALEVDRLEVEHLRLLSQVGEAEAVRESALGACSQLLGMPCPQFHDEAEARRFLAQAESAPRPTADAVPERPAIRALVAREQSAEAERTLASRRPIPDPTVTVGYTRDQFVASGNQANSVNVAVSLPLPVFDRGQVDEARARRTRETASATRQALLASAAESVRRGRTRIDLLARRATVLDKDAVPRAQAVLDRTEAAARRGGVALQEVLLARRALEELQLDRVEVAAEHFRVLLDVRRAAGPPPPPAPRP